jgi:alpha-glucosidase (family GH31 glycosyl hydrolase)
MTDLREAPLATAHPWFFELYADLLADPATSVAARFNDIDPTDPIAAALALYLAALAADKALLTSPRGITLRALVQSRLDRELSPSQNNFTDTWVIVLWAAALREANHLIPDEATTRLVAKVKNHVYARHTSAGTLMASSDRQTLDYDVLLAAVPFGLFDVEDLVLVDAVRKLTTPERLATATPADLRLLGWYHAEQGSYAKARKAVGSGTLGRILTRRLTTLGQLDARFIRHSPMGNGNRYEPLIEERFPKLVTDRDDVLVRAQASPLSPDEPLELVVGDMVIDGRFETDHWSFRIPRRPAGSVVDYAIRFRDHSEVVQGPFRYEVLARRLGSISAANPARLSLAAGDIGREFAAGPITIRDVTCLTSADGRVHAIEAKIISAASHFYGFGERYNALDQAGNFVDQFVYNQYKEQGLRTYMPMPVAYTDAGFGLHLATDAYSYFDLENPREIIVGVEAESLEIELLTGSVAEQVSQFMALTGDPEPVPAWALGPWMSSNNWDSEGEVRQQVALTLEHQVPATVLVIEAWSDEATFYIWNDAQYAEKPGEEAFDINDFTYPEWGRWPSPKAMVEHLHDNDLKLILWQIPIIKQSPSLKHAQKRRDETHFLEAGYGVTHPDGTALRLPEGWFKDSLLMDFTNPAGRDWWFAKRQYLLNDFGVDGFKTDGGEMVWGRDLRFADGRTGLEHRNTYPRDYISAYYRFAQQNGGICFSRAGYTGAQTFPAHWAGDERSTWEAFKRSILAGLSAGMSGVIFWGWDMAGFSGEVPSAELYVRSAQMACFCPIMQYHAESKAEFNQDRTPWNIAERSGDERALTGYRFYANLRMSLMPYLTRESAWCVAEKQPLMRALLLDFPGDVNTAHIWDQYMFGRDLLVAPIIREGDISRYVTLPPGRWWHLFHNRWYEGQQQVTAPLEEIPVFLRDDAALPLVFEREAHLGASMPNSLDTPKRRILLVTGTATYDGLTITRTGTHVAITGTANLTIVFADPTVTAEHDGHPVPVCRHDLSGTPLAAVVLTA